MENYKLLYILIIFALIAYAFIKAYKMYNARCPKCGGRLKLQKLEDPMGLNVTKKFAVSLFVGPRKYKEYWKCQSCGNESIQQYWGS